MEKDPIITYEDYQKLFATIQQGFCVVEVLFDAANKPIDYHIVHANAAFEKQTGLSEVVGKKASEIIPDLEEYWFSNYEIIAQTGETVRLVNYSASLKRWFEVDAFHLGERNSHRIALLFTDITAQKKNEEEPKRLQDQFTLTLENSFNGFMLFDDQGQIMDVNGLGAELMGFENKAACIATEDLAGLRRAVYERFTIKDELGNPLLSELSPVARAYKGEKDPQTITHFIDKRNGKESWFLLKARRVAQPDGLTKFVVLTITDITRLKETETRFSIMADNISQLAWITDEKGSIFWYNQRWFEYTGTHIDDMIGWGWTQVHHPDHLDRVLAKLKHCFESGTDWEDTFPLRSKTGEYRWFLSRAIAIRDEKGEITNWFGTNTDITGQLEISEKLSYQKGLMEAMVKTSPVGTLVVGPNRKILMVNERFREIHRIRANDLLGKDEFYIWELTRELLQDAAAPEALLEKVHRERMPTHGSFIFRDGRIIEWYGAPVLGEKKEYFGYAFSYLDVTERERLLRQKDDFLGVASHELKTPVTSILAYNQLLQKKFELSEDRSTHEMLRRMYQQINRLTVLINDLLDVTRIEQGKLKLRRESFNFNEMVTEFLEEVQTTAPSHRINLHQNGSREVVADRDRIGQVVTNFLTNAIKYSPKAETIDVSIRYDARDVRFSVQDYGLGIREADQEKVFQRFFRVEGNDRATFSGLGLGLFICSEIIQRHGGRIGLQSKEQEGSIFYFTLPLVNESDKYER